MRANYAICVRKQFQYFCYPAFLTSEETRGKEVRGYFAGFKAPAYLG